MKAKSPFGNYAATPLRRLWVFSDLQQSDPVNASRCMHTGVEDFLSLGLDIDAVCYLGDSTEGTNLAHLEEMADMQVRELARVDAPVYYAMGNHEFDYHRWVEGPSKLTIPMRERILREPQWHTSASTLDWSFRKDFGDLVLFFLTDRCDEADGTWVTTHCGQRNIKGCEMSAHDFGPDAARVRDEMAALDKPFFTFSHYGFPGGNRDGEGPLQEMLLPLPDLHVAHFYGHSHIGDKVWGKQNVFRQVSTINDSPTSQFDVASLENLRGSAIRSAIVEWYGGHRFGVFFRNHTTATWEKCLVEHAPPIR